MFPLASDDDCVKGFDDRRDDQLTRLCIATSSAMSLSTSKANIQDFPETVAYGEKMDDLRQRYKDYSMGRQFHDTLCSEGVQSTVRHTADYSVFSRKMVDCRDRR